MVTVTGCAPGLTAALPEPGRSGPPLGIRMLDLVWRVARRAGLSRRASARLCNTVLTDASNGDDNPALFWSQPQVGTDARRTRSRVLAVVRQRLATAVDSGLLERAVTDAVVCDECAELPHRQRLVLRMVVEQRASVETVATATGWTADQVGRLLRAGLRTVATRTDCR